MSRLIARHGVIECPVCDVRLLTLIEWDRRLALMQHPVTPMCCFGNLKFRVNRLNGDAEIIHEA